MKLSWRDIVNTLLVAAGGVVLYAKLQDFTWTIVTNWRATVASLGVLGLTMFVVAGSEMNRRGLFNEIEAGLGLVCFGLIIAGLIWSNAVLGVSLAIGIGLTWLISTARHARRNIIHRPSTRFHAPAH